LTTFDRFVACWPLRADATLLGNSWDRHSCRDKPLEDRLVSLQLSLVYAAELSVTTRTLRDWSLRFSPYFCCHLVGREPQKKVSIHPADHELHLQIRRQWDQSLDLLSGFRPPVVAVHPLAHRNVVCMKHTQDSLKRPRSGVLPHRGSSSQCHPSPGGFSGRFARSQRWSSEKCLKAHSGVSRDVLQQAVSPPLPPQPPRRHSTQQHCSVTWGAHHPWILQRWYHRPLRWLSVACPPASFDRPSLYASIPKVVHKSFVATLMTFTVCDVRSRGIARSSATWLSVQRDDNSGTVQSASDWMRS